MPLLRLREVEEHAVADAVLERDRLGAAGVRHDVLARVAVRADMVVLDDEVVRGPHVDAVRLGPDPLGELLVRLVDEQHRRRHAGEGHHVRVDRHGEGDDGPQPSTPTIPLAPLTRLRAAVLTRSPALPVPTTAGMPNSRATTAGCEVAPPASVTRPLIFVKSTTQAGFVMRQTRMSPLLTWSNSSSEETNRAGPSTTPGDAGRPLISPVVAGSPAQNRPGKPQSPPYGNSIASFVAVPSHAGARRS